MRKVFPFTKAIIILFVRHLHVYFALFTLNFVFVLLPSPPFSTVRFSFYPGGKVAGGFFEDWAKINGKCNGFNKKGLSLTVHKFIMRNKKNGKKVKWQMTCGVMEINVKK